MEQTDKLGDDLETRVTDLVIRLIILGLFAYLSLGLLRPFVSMFVWAVILTVALFPVYRSLAAGGGLPQRLSRWPRCPSCLARLRP